LPLIRLREQVFKRWERDMGIRCQVLIDGSRTGDSYTFPSVPRVGDDIEIERQASRQILMVESVLFIAQGEHENPTDGNIRLAVSTVV
jgi:hypothetical protein